MKFANMVQNFIIGVFPWLFKLPERIRQIALKFYTNNLSFPVGLLVFALMFMLLPHTSGPLRCNDGTASSSIGHKGACSWHGGVERRHAGVRFVFSIGIGYLASYLYGRRRDAVLKRKNEESGPGKKTPLHRQDKTSTNQGALLKCPICGRSMWLRVLKNGDKQWVCAKPSGCPGFRPLE